MITFEGVSKSYESRGLVNEVLSNLTFSIGANDRLAICGANGAGKSTLMRLLAGVELPTRGTVARGLRTSWPIGLSSCFEAQTTGADNARFIARIYGRDEEALLDFVEDFAQLGLYLHQPVVNYSSGMISRLAFGISLAIDFQCYLVDEVTAVGDTRFRQRCEEELLARCERAALVMTSHDPGTLERYCTRAAVLYGGTLTFYDSVSEALETHHRLQLNAPRLVHAS